MQPHDLQPGKKKKRNRWLGWLVPTPEQKKENMYSVVALVHPYYIFTYIHTYRAARTLFTVAVRCVRLHYRARAPTVQSSITTELLTTTYLHRYVGFPLSLDHASPPSPLVLLFDFATM